MGNDFWLASRWGGCTDDVVPNPGIASVRTAWRMRMVFGFEHLNVVGPC
jgi:hypothetical protein